ncbi:MAG: tRNA (N6-threonylcarbamoyladenosine(37)-N6)-methyltransferase TrmO [Elusimicrobiaceae bacterium]|nr:tRNA (N6-threonylcarbamoyladenosine(37)-N6)-methyltransferase TrmO [Elusimicrobiaceae bacterium]
MKLDITPVGYVRNAVKNRSDMKPGGVASTIEISPAFRPALKGLELCTHIWALCWFDRADRSVLKARPRKISSAAKERGVFAMRSPDRPNPVALTCARLLKIRGLTLTLASLDAADGTPVLDIKPYSRGIDCVPVAGDSDFSAKYRLLDDTALARLLARLALNHTAALTPQAIKALALTFGYVRAAGLAPDCDVSAVESTVSKEGIDVLCGLFGLRPSDGKYTPVSFRGAAALSVKTRTAWVTVEAGRKETDEFRKLL